MFSHRHQFLESLPNGQLLLHPRDLLWIFSTFLRELAIPLNTHLPRAALDLAHPRMEHLPGAPSLPTHRSPRRHRPVRRQVQIDYTKDGVWSLKEARRRSSLPALAMPHARLNAHQETDIRLSLTLSTKATSLRITSNSNSNNTFHHTDLHAHTSTLHIAQTSDTTTRKDIHLHRHLLRTLTILHPGAGKDLLDPTTLMTLLITHNNYHHPHRHPNPGSADLLVKDQLLPSAGTRRHHDPGATLQGTLHPSTHLHSGR